MGAAIDGVGSQVRSFIPAGREGGREGGGLAHLAGQAQPSGASLPPPRHQPTGKGLSGQWEGAAGLAGLRELPDPPRKGVSPPSFPLSPSEPKVTPCWNIRGIPALTDAEPSLGALCAERMDLHPALSRARQTLLTCSESASRVNAMNETHPFLHPTMVQGCNRHQSHSSFQSFC